MNNQKRIEIARDLLFKLERLSADSSWAHRASGLRGSLLKLLVEIEQNNFSSQSIKTLDHLDALTQAGFQILENAARELRSKENT